MFTVAEIKAFLLTKGMTVKTIKAFQSGDGENTFTVNNPKTIYFGHISGSTENLPDGELARIDLYLEPNVGFQFAGSIGNPPHMFIPDCFFRYATLQYATALFVGYKIDLV